MHLFGPTIQFEFLDVVLVKPDDWFEFKMAAAFVKFIPDFNRVLRLFQEFSLLNEARL